MASRALKNRTGVKKKHPITGFLSAGAIFVALIVSVAIGAYNLGASWLDELPDYSNASAYNYAKKTVVYANDGKTMLGEFFVENREPIALDQVGDYVKYGTIATEDERYYEHGGIDLWGIARALVVNVSGSSREGASTITQQFVRATVLSEEANDISLKRKVREMYISLKLEEMYTKDEILLMYLNTINYGSGAYGIEAAAKTYFSKSAIDLTLVEAATLIGIPQSPTYNNPVDNPDNCVQRRNLVLDRMLSNGYITQEEYDAAVAEPLTLNREEKGDNGIYLYPYFTDYIQKKLAEMYSFNEVFKGGLTVYTTLDPSIQAMAEEAARNREATMDEDVEVALTAVDPETGYILAMVGGKDFHTSPFNLATQAKRSCGSTFKMFTLIAALEEGVSPSTYISCSAQVNIDEWDWKPKNINGIDYGTRTIASAFAVSSNTAFARLITVLSPDAVIDVAERMGIKSNLDSVPAITLGGDVSTDEMAGAIATVANGGTYHEPIGISKIVDYSGETIYEADTKGKRVLTSEIAYAATKVMKGVVQYGTGTAASLYSGQPVIGKTGTSENGTDSYFIGSTPQISVAIWVGTRDMREMKSSFRADRVFRDFVGNVLDGQEIEDFPVADDPEYTYFSSSKFNIGITPKKEEPKEEETEEKSKTEADKKESSDSGKKENADSDKKESTDSDEKDDSGSGGSGSGDAGEGDSGSKDPGSGSGEGSGGGTSGGGASGGGAGPKTSADTSSG